MEEFRKFSSSVPKPKPIQDKEWALNNRRNYFKRCTIRTKKTNTNKNNTVTNGEYWKGVLWVKEQFLGEGAYGSVFLVKRKQPTHFTNLPSDMAVKTASFAQASTLKYEKQMFSSLSGSPYVIKCYGDLETETAVGEKIYNLFLEFCSGGSLLDHINRSSSNGLPEPEVRRYTRDVVRGLSYIHSNGVVHCDIKPDNILLVPGKDGGFTAKLADFGLAKNLDYEDQEEYCLKGTYRYMSPELVKDKILAYPADIWALGCVVVEMMSGRAAWEYGTREELLSHIGYSKEVPLFPRNISEDGKDFLYKCFIRDFVRRWTAEELLEHPFLCVDVDE